MGWNHMSWLFKEVEKDSELVNFPTWLSSKESTRQY